MVRKATGNYVFQSEFDISRYGIDTQNSKLTYNVNKLSAYEGQKPQFLGQYPGNKIKIEILAEARDIILLEVTRSDSHLI